MRRLLRAQSSTPPAVAFLSAMRPRESELGEMIATAQSEVVDRIGPALDEFAKTAPELASLLKVVLEELADPRVHGFGISEDGITMLHSSARTFANLENSANLLAGAADTLKNVQSPGCLVSHQVRAWAASMGVCG
ncbi:hypothetical protein ACFQ10_54155 [Streptomyces indonesiensis]